MGWELPEGHADCAAYSPPPQFPRQVQQAGKPVPGLRACVSAVQLKIHWAGGSSDCSLPRVSSLRLGRRSTGAHLTTVAFGKLVAGWCATGGITSWSPLARRCLSWRFRSSFSVSHLIPLHSPQNPVTLAASSLDGKAVGWPESHARNKFLAALGC